MQSLEQLEQKVIHITFPDNTIWGYPAALVAHERAAYYAANDCGQDVSLDYTEVYNQEYRYTLESDDELLDFIKASNNWSDLKDNVFFVGVVGEEDEKDMYEEWWMGEAETEVVGGP